MVEELACEGKSPTELARGPHGLSYHQVNRRAGLFKTSGLLTEWQGPGRRRCYGLTEKTRRKMGLIAGIARWRHHHVVAEDEEGMTATEMATVLRLLLPLANLPEHAGKCLRLSVRGEEEAAGAEGEEVWAEVEPGGAIVSCASTPAEPDGWGRGMVKDWIPMILDGRDDQVLVGGNGKLVCEALRDLYEVLWSPAPF